MSEEGLRRMVDHAWEDFHEVLPLMRKAMENHAFWWKAMGTPLENDLPIRATQVAMGLLARHREELSAPQSEGWRDIASAPRDGTTVLLWGDGLATEPLVARWTEWTDNLARREREGWREGADLIGDELFGATHWQPLPTPPALHTPREAGE